MPSDAMIAWAKRLGRPLRPCAVCQTTLTPCSATTMTAHEFDCYKRQPHKIPHDHMSQYLATLAWERRSIIAKKAAVKRRKK